MLTPKTFTARIEMIMRGSYRKTWRVMDMARAMGFPGTQGRGDIRAAFKASKRFKRIGPGLYALKEVSEDEP